MRDSPVGGADGVPKVLKFAPDPCIMSSGRFVRHDTAC